MSNAKESQENQEAQQTANNFGVTQPINGHVTKSYNTSGSTPANQRSWSPSGDSQNDVPGSDKRRCFHEGCCCCCACCPGSVSRRLYRVRRSTVRLWILGLFLIGYVVVGSLIFMALEDPLERKIRTELRTSRSEFLLDHICVEDAELETFIVEIIDANNRGVSAARNVSSEPNWSFGQSLFFAGTILTTIGYGHVTPLSEGGKVFCIVYAAIGIPLTLIMFTALVERLMVLTTRLLQALTEQLGHLYKTIHIRLIHLSILLLVLTIFVFLIPSAVFTVLEENWNFLDAFYYCFISMTTIGLGDYIPGDDPEQGYRPLYKIFTTFYLFIGLVMMMLTLANIYDVPELNLGYHFYMRSDEDECERASLRTGEPVTKYTQQVNRAYSEDGTRADEHKQLTDN